MEYYSQLLSRGQGVIKKDPYLAKKYSDMAKKIDAEYKKDDDKPKLMHISIFNSLNDNCKELVLSAEKGDHLSLVKVFKGFFRGINYFPFNRQIGESYLKFAIQDLLDEQILIHAFKNQIKSYFEYGIENNVTLHYTA